MGSLFRFIRERLSKEEGGIIWLKITRIQQMFIFFVLFEFVRDMLR